MFFHCSNNRIVRGEKIYFVQICLGPSIPSLRGFSLPSNYLLATLDENAAVQHQTNISSMPRYRTFSVSLPVREGEPVMKARVRQTIPPVMRDYEEFKFPLVVNV